MNAGTRTALTITDTAMETNTQTTPESPLRDAACSPSLVWMAGFHEAPHLHACEHPHASRAKCGIPMNTNVTHETPEQRECCETCWAIATAERQRDAALSTLWEITKRNFVYALNFRDDAIP